MYVSSTHSLVIAFFLTYFAMAVLVRFLYIQAFPAVSVSKK